VLEARDRVVAGELGAIRKILVEYVQGWLATPIEREGQRQASWRLDPKQAGASSCMGDIGVHAFQIAESVSGLRATELCSVLDRHVPGRTLDDDGTVLLRYGNGASGVLAASQIAVGEENALTLRVYGEKGALAWRQEEPNTLWLNYLDRPGERVRTGLGYLGAAAKRNTRLPSGHPEGYVEAFANLYRNFAASVRAHAAGEPPANEHRIPGIADALRGMAFIETAVAASGSDRKWHALPNVG
jgi:predicted dehydrogenase